MTFSKSLLLTNAKKGKKKENSVDEKIRVKEEKGSGEKKRKPWNKNTKSPKIDILQKWRHRAVALDSLRKVSLSQKDRKVSVGFEGTKKVWI